jgi:hypothetical protein
MVTFSMDPTIDVAAPPRTADRRYPVNRLEERITTAAKRSSALSDAWQKCR